MLYLTCTTEGNIVNGLFYIMALCACKICNTAPLGTTAFQTGILLDVWHMSKEFPFSHIKPFSFVLQMAQNVIFL